MIVMQTEKQPAQGDRGLVVTNHHLGSAAGLEMLALGGNAFDAAVAALFTLTVVEPMMVGVFGAGWMTLRTADGEIVTIDNYACAPAAAAPDLYTPLSDSWPDYLETVDQANRIGWLAVGVPGTLRAWTEVLARYGRLDLESVMQPALRHAERGFTVSGYLSEIVHDKAGELARFAETRALFLPGDQPLPPGTILRQPALAESLRAIAQAGPDVLYDGALGQTIVESVRRGGGILTMDDLRAYGTVQRPALRGKYRGYTVHVPPLPCSGGLHILQILQLLTGYDVADLGFGTPAGTHLLAECLKIAFADRTRYVGDPAQVDVPLAWLLSAEYADERRATLDMTAAQTPRFAPGGHPPPVTWEPATTTHVTTADDEGNIACMTQTINDAFGAKVMGAGTGILLNNTMALFDPHPGQANSVAGGKRMVSSMSPTIVTRDGEPFLALGTPGGVRIFPAVLQALVNVIDHGMTLQEAVEAPRLWTQGQTLELEEGFAAPVATRLAEMGHPVQRVVTVAGGMNGVQFAPGRNGARGMMTGAACWRADGTPMAMSGGRARPGIRFRTVA
jgi:gamma-glutamyltranspeptidase / glutathione hydrolase